MLLGGGHDPIGRIAQVRGEEVSSLEGGGGPRGGSRLVHVARGAGRRLNRGGHSKRMEKNG